MPFASPFKLKKRGILGMNSRNSNFILNYNDREFYQRVDDKLVTKKIAIEEGIKVPKLICSIKYNFQIKDVHAILANVGGFVIKPSQGAAGKGIMILKGAVEGGYEKMSGEILPQKEIDRHIAEILSGLYSLGGKTDAAMFEGLIHFTDTFTPYTFQGVPDIRVISFLGFPVMAMVRLPTSVSDGKANLHQGAVGVGIDIVTGKASNAVQFDKKVTKHPDTGNEFSNLKIPFWDEILHMSSRGYEMTELGYLGADIVLDKDHGPMILELNARPGLAIQIANDIGLETRLRQIEKVYKRNMHVERRVQIAKELFAP